jgi:hypothetical protein
MSILNPLQFYLCIIKPETAFTATVSSNPSDPYIAIPFTGGATGTAGMIVEGNTLQVGTTAGANDIGEVRIKGVTGTSSGYVYVAETDDTGPLIQSGHHLTGLREWRLWPKVPRQDATDPNNIIYYEDYDLAYTDQLSAWKPIAVAGPPAVIFLENGIAQADFVGDRSYALAPSATIASQKWTAPGSNQVTSTSLGTEGTPVSFTYSTAGQYTVSFEVTDSNGNTAINYTWVIVIDPENPTNVITKFDDYNDSADRSQGGLTANFSVRGAITIADLPRNAMVIHASRGDLITHTGTWPFRGNTQFCGYVVGGTVTQDPYESVVSFQAASITHLMKQLALYPHRLESAGTPANWTQASNMTVGRILSFLAHYRSTLSLMAPIIEFPYTELVKAQDFGFDSLYSQANKLLQDAWGGLIANHQGVLYPEIHYQVMLDSERSSVNTGKALNKNEWIGAADIQERPTWSTPVRKVKQSGVLWDGTTAIPLFSEAPGDVQSDWGNEQAKDSLILSSQDDLNTRCGREFARHRSNYPAIRLNFLNEGTFQLVPQRLYTITTESGDNNRGVALTASGIISRIRREYDHINSLVKSNVEFDVVQAGVAGGTVVMPVKPPSLTGGGTSSSNGPQPPPPTEEDPPDFNTLIIVIDAASGPYKRETV